MKLIKLLTVEMKKRDQIVYLDRINYFKQLIWCTLRNILAFYSSSLLLNVKGILNYSFFLSSLTGLVPQRLSILQPLQS